MERKILRRLRSGLTYSNVMASVAVFTAMGGSAYAAATITGKDVRNGSLTGADLKNGSVTGRDLKNRSVSSADVKNGTLRASDFRAGALPQGPQGERGPAGPAGPAGPSGATARWLLINENGEIEEQSGGFTVVSRPGINGQPATNPNYYVDAGASLVGKGLTATIAIQNRIDRTGDATPDPAFGGDTAVARCNTAAVVCAPTGTNTDRTLVVRALANNADATSQTRRVFVVVTS